MARHERGLTALAALSGLGGVAFGAFAAHGLIDPTARDLARTGASWETTQALAALAAIALARIGLIRTTLAAALFLVGTVLFSGSLYALALGAPRWTGAITPAGGLAFMAGWAAILAGALAGARKSPAGPCRQGHGSSQSGPIPTSSKTPGSS